MQHDRAPLTTIRGEYHGPIVVAFGRYGSVASSTLHLSFDWVHWTRLEAPVLGLLGLSCYSLDLIGLNFLLFS